MTGRELTISVYFPPAQIPLSSLTHHILPHVLDHLNILSPPSLSSFLLVISPQQPITLTTLSHHPLLHSYNPQPIARNLHAQEQKQKQKQTSTEISLTIHTPIGPESKHQRFFFCFFLFAFCFCFSHFHSHSYLIGLKRYGYGYRYGWLFTMILQGKKDGDLGGCFFGGEEFGFLFLFVGFRIGG